MVWIVSFIPIVPNKIEPIDRRLCSNQVFFLKNTLLSSFCNLTPFVRKVNDAIHTTNLYPVHNAISFPNTHPLDGDLSGG